MNHISDDIIIKFALETLDHGELELIRNHLADCIICSDKLNATQKEIEILSSFNPEVGGISFQNPKVQSNFNNWVKWVAVLLIGFITGYSSSVLFPTSKTIVVEQHLITQTPKISEIQFISCSNVDLW